MKFLAFALALTGILAHAEPAWKSELSSPALGPHPALAPCVLDFQISWKGLLNSGSLKMEFAPPDVKKAKAFVVRANATSLGAAASLFPYTANFWAELNPISLRPGYFQSIETDREEIITHAVRYLPSAVEIRRTAKLTATGKSSVGDTKFQFTPVFDIFSAMLHVRSQPLVVGDKIALVVCPSKAPILLRLKVTAREKHNGRDAIRLSLGIQKIDARTHELKPYKKLRQEATMWLSDDAARIPIEFRAAVFIGDVRATLSKQAFGVQ